MVIRKHRRSSQLLSKALSSSQFQYMLSMGGLFGDEFREIWDISQDNTNTSSSSVLRDKVNVVDTSVVESFLSDAASRARKARRVGRVRIVGSKVDRIPGLVSPRSGRKIRRIIKDKPFTLPTNRPFEGKRVEPPRPWPHK